MCLCDLVFKELNESGKEVVTMSLLKSPRQNVGRSARLGTQKQEHPIGPHLGSELMNLTIRKHGHMWTVNASLLSVEHLAKLWNVTLGEPRERDRSRPSARTVKAESDRIAFRLGELDVSCHGYHVENWRGCPLEVSLVCQQTKQLGAIGSRNFESRVVAHPVTLEDDLAVLLCDVHAAVRFFERQMSVGVGEENANLISCVEMSVVKPELKVHVPTGKLYAPVQRFPVEILKRNLEIVHVVC